MRRKLIAAYLLAGITAAFMAACASTGGGAGGKGVLTGRNFDSLNSAVELERSKERMPSRLWERGHAYLEEAERLNDPRAGEAERAKLFETYGRYYLAAIRDFTLIVESHAGSPEAPEALFHLGVVYDYPNLGSFSTALGYYRRTLETYPGTNAADKARQSIEHIESLMKLMREAHGEEGG